MEDEDEKKNWETLYSGGCVVPSLVLLCICRSGLPSRNPFVGFSSFLDNTHTHTHKHIYIYIQGTWAQAQT